MTGPAGARAAVPLLHRPLTVHACKDIVFAHRRHDPTSLAGLVPRGRTGRPGGTVQPRHDASVRHGWGDVVR